MGRKSKPTAKELANLKPTIAPDNPGQTVAISARIRLDQKAWLDKQQESHGVLIRRALDLLIGLEQSKLDRPKTAQSGNKPREKFGQVCRGRFPAGGGAEFPPGGLRG